MTSMSGVMPGQRVLRQLAAAALGVLSAFALSTETPPDPERMPIGRAGDAVVKAAGMVDTKTLREATPEAVAAAADGVRFVYLGEGHTNAAHHAMQAKIIEALVKRGRDVIVGFEMFTRPKQEDLNPWSLGWWSEDEFVRRSEWKTQWGFDFALYRPIFEVVKENRLPMIALNVPRDWVRAVGRGGLSALTPEQRRQLPQDIDLGWKEHRAVFNAMMGGHPMTGADGDHMYAAQVLWDVGMADSILKYWDRCPRSSRTVIVIVAGAGHVMYGLGINGRVAKRTGERGLTVTMVEATDKATVSRGISDYVYAAPATSE
jgi:uncharacterized iron-regulated protein